MNKFVENLYNFLKKGDEKFPVEFLGMSDRPWGMRFFRFGFRNVSEKEIKYFKMKYYMYNRVGDAVKNSGFGIWHYWHCTTGPIVPSKQFMIDVYPHGGEHEIDVRKITVVYMDNTRASIGSRYFNGVLKQISPGRNL